MRADEAAVCVTQYSVMLVSSSSFVNTRLRIAVAVAPGPELLDDPGRQPDRRIVQRHAEGLRLRALDLLIARFLVLECLANLQTLALAIGQSRIRIGARGRRAEHMLI